MMKLCDLAIGLKHSFEEILQDKNHLKLFYCFMKISLASNRKNMLNQNPSNLYLFIAYSHVFFSSVIA